MKNEGLSALFVMLLGTPAAIEDTCNPDWAPTVNLGYASCVPHFERCNRSLNRGRKCPGHYDVGRPTQVLTDEQQSDEINDQVCSTRCM